MSPCSSGQCHSDGGASWREKGEEGEEEGSGGRGRREGEEEGERGGGREGVGGNERYTVHPLEW